MKKVFLTSITLIVFFLSSCNGDFMEKENINKKLNPEEFKFIGKQHNNGLDFILLKLKSSEISRSKLKILSKNYRTSTEQEIMDEVEIYTNDFIGNYSSLNNDPTVDYAYKIIEEVFDGRPLISPSGKLYVDEVGAYLSNSEKMILDDLNIVLSDDDYDIISLNNRIESIELRVSSMNLTEKEQFIIYSSTSVAKYSLAYWKDNYMEWRNTLIDEELTSTRVNGFSWKSVGKNDVAGAAAVGVAGLFGPIGWGTFASGVIGGAVGGSAYDAVLQLF